MVKALPDRDGIMTVWPGANCSDRSLVAIPPENAFWIRLGEKEFSAALVEYEASKMSLHRKNTKHRFQCQCQSD